MKTTHQILLTDEYIAEAQRLAVAQNTVLRLMHQTWWFFWVQRFILLGAAIVFWSLGDSNFFVFSLAVMFCLSFLGPFLSRRNFTKIRRQFRAKGTTTTVSMDAAGIDMQGALGYSGSLPPTWRWCVFRSACSVRGRAILRSRKSSDG
jgi:hypothetical protein